MLCNANITSGKASECVDGADIQKVHVQVQHLHVVAPGEKSAIAFDACQQDVYSSILASNNALFDENQKGNKVRSGVGRKRGVPR